MLFGQCRKRSCRAPTTALLHPPTPSQRCSRRSIGSTASPVARSPPQRANATSALSLIENATARLTPDEDKTMTARTPLDRRYSLRLLGALAGLSVVLGACTYTSGEVVTASVPDDYRMRHPIAVTEADSSIVIFVGHARGGLSPSQRADVIGLARTWVREATGAIVADVPVDTPNARAAAATFREVQAVLEAGGVPARGITLHHYHPEDPRVFATIRLSYPKIRAVAGPCGLWPEDIGLSST